MNGIKVLIIMGLVMAGIVGAISAIAVMIPYVLMVIGVLAIARMLVRQSDRSQLISIGAEKDETHSPEQTRPSQTMK